MNSDGQTVSSKSEALSHIHIQGKKKQQHFLEIQKSLIPNFVNVPSECRDIFTFELQMRRSRFLLRATVQPTSCHLSTLVSVYPWVIHQT